ncbi:MAG: 50S ribosomal protein L22 [Armatimonadetes bacterium]|nr:50S ribosomal protein L22 [Armatimonadota bacterium]
MEVRAVAKYLRVQPRKVRIVADEVRGSSAVRTAEVLRFHPSKGAFYLRKVLISAMANAQENLNISPENLRIATVMVDEGPKMKRITARSMGRANRILKKTSHITVVVEEYEPAGKVKPHGTKSKARPKFEAPKKAKGAKKEAVAEETVAEPVTEETVETGAVEPEAVAEAPVAEETAAETPGAEAPVAKEEEQA